MILDQFGNGISTRMIKGASQFNRALPYELNLQGDLDKLIPVGDRKTLLSVSRRLFSNMGIPRGAIFQKAGYAIGRAWDLVYTGQDKEWGREVIDILTNEWFPTCDVRGPSFDWKTGLFLDSVSLDRDGDFGYLLTETETGWPQLQRIGAHRISQRSGDKEIVEYGQFRGRKICNGVIRNDYGRPIGYRVLGEEEEDDQDIPANQLRLAFDPEYHDQYRGIPGFSHAANELRSSLLSHEWEQMALLMLSSIGLIERNDFGGPDMNDPANLGTQTDTDNGLIATRLEGGTIRYFRSESGNGLEQLKQERPSDVWDRFQDRVARNALTGFGWPLSMVWKATGQGTAERSDLQKAQASVIDRQDVIEPHAKAIIGWAVAKLIKRGRIPEPREIGGWSKWRFTKPPKISIDPNKDAQTILKLWRAGLANQDSALADLGYGDEEQFYRQRAESVALRRMIQNEVSERTGVEITERDMVMLTDNEPVTTENDSNDDEENPTNNQSAQDAG